MEVEPHSVGAVPVGSIIEWRYAPEMRKDEWVNSLQFDISGRSEAWPEEKVFVRMISFSTRRPYVASPLPGLDGTCLRLRMTEPGVYNYHDQNYIWKG